MLKKLLKKCLYDDEFSPPSPSMSFSHAMNFAFDCLKNENDIEQKIVLLDFMMHTIREDLKVSTLTTLFYNKKNFENYKRTLFFPTNYYDENNTKLSTYAMTFKGRRRVSLTEDCVVVVPWSQEKFRSSIKKLKRKNFEYHADNHFSTYFKPLDICRIENGYHSVSAGIGYKKGEILAKEIDVTHSFPHINTDGDYWYNTHTNEKLGPVFDFRIAIIFELTKLKYELITTT